MPRKVICKYMSMHKIASYIEGHLTPNVTITENENFAPNIFIATDYGTSEGP